MEKIAIGLETVLQAENVPSVLLKVNNFTSRLSEVTSENFRKLISQEQPIKSRSEALIVYIAN